MTFRDFSLWQQADKIATETKQWSKYFIKKRFLFYFSINLCKDTQLLSILNNLF